MLAVSYRYTVVITIPSDGKQEIGSQKNGHMLKVFTSNFL